MVVSTIMYYISLARKYGIYLLAIIYVLCNLTFQLITLNLFNRLYFNEEDLFLLLSFFLRKSILGISITPVNMSSFEMMNELMFYNF